MNNKAKRFVINLIDIISTPEMEVLPGNLAFFFLLALIPIITITIFLFGFIHISPAEMTLYLQGLFPEEVLGILSIENWIRIDKVSFAVFLFSALFLASNATSSMIIASNSLYKIKGTGFIERRIKAFIMVTILMSLLTFVIVVPTLGDFIIDLLFKSSNIHVILSRAFQLLRFPLSMFVIYVFIKLLYTLAPDKTINSKDTTFGALFTSVGWLISSRVFSFYIGTLSYYNVLYGSLSGLLVMLLWFYLLAYIFVLGMAFNATRTWDIIK